MARRRRNKVAFARAGLTVASSGADRSYKALGIPGIYLLERIAT
jgi:hypothetical protein